VSLDIHRLAVFVCSGQPNNLVWIPLFAPKGTFPRFGWKDRNRTYRKWFAVSIHKIYSRIVIFVQELNLLGLIKSQIANQSLQLVCCSYPKSINRIAFLRCLYHWATPPQLVGEAGFEPRALRLEMQLVCCYNPKN